MKQNLKTPIFERLNHITILLFFFGTPFIMLYRHGFENKQMIMLLLFGGCFALGIYSVIKIIESSQSVFINIDYGPEKIENIIKKMSEEKPFKILPNLKSGVMRLQYVKYGLSLDYEIHFYIMKDQIEFNAFCNNPGLFDFGARKRILNLVKDKIEFHFANPDYQLG